MRNNHCSHLLTVAAVVFAICLPSVLNGAKPKKSKGKKYHPVAQVVDIQSIVDSALIMADNYCEAVAGKPEIASARLNIIKNYYSAKPEQARDSIRERLFNLYVEYVAQEKTERADAFKNCFLELAPDSDLHLGRIYTNELNGACERFDTTAVKKYIPLLEDFASRMEFDYDAELAQAYRFLHTMRTRRPISEAIPGVWVSEDISDDFDEKYPLINTLKVLQIRDRNSYVYEKTKKDSANVRKLEVLKTSKNLAYNATFGVEIGGYHPIGAWEMEAYNMKPFSSDYVSKTKIRNPLFFDANCTSRKVETDNDAYSIYVFWGDERLKRSDPEIAAMIRQTVQQTQAAVAGELSRSTYSFGTSFAGNLTSGLVSAGVNALVDAMMVSTDKIWSVETTLHMENPNCLTAYMFGRMIVSKSNSSKPEIYEYEHATKYYRWEPQDSIFFFGAYNTAVYSTGSPWRNDGGRIYLHYKTKEEEKADKAKVKKYCKQWKAWYKKELANKKALMKTFKKNSREWQDAKKDYKEFKDNPPQVWQDWNKQMIDKLKAKAENYTD